MAKLMVAILTTGVNCTTRKENIQNNKDQIKNVTLLKTITDSN